MKKLLVWFIVLTMTVFLIGSFALTGCKNATAAAGITAAEVTTTEATTAGETTTQTTAEGEKVTIYFWNWWGNLEKTYSKIIDDFEAENPNIDVVYRALGYNEYVPAWKAALVAQEGIDMFPIYPISMIVELQKVNQILDLTQYAEKYGWLKDMKEAYTEPLIYQGKLYSVPAEGNHFCMMYRPDVFEKNNIKFPETLDEWIAISDTLNSKGIVPISMPGKEGWQCADLFFQVAAQTASNELLRKADLGQVSWESPEIVEAFKIIAKMRDANLFGKNALGTDMTSSWKLLWDGKSAALMDMGCGFVQAWNADFPEIDWSLYKGMLFPAVKEGAIPRSVGSFGANYAVASFSPHIDETIKFIDFLLRPENILAECIANTSMPPYKTFNTEALTKDNPNVPADIYNWWLSVDSEKATRDFYTPEITDAVNTGIQQLIGGQVTPEQLAANIQKVSESVKR